MLLSDPAKARQTLEKSILARPPVPTSTGGLQGEANLYFDETVVL